MHIPDLLSLKPQITIDETSLKETLSFAFATGRAPALLGSCLVDRNRSSQSHWDPAFFQDDLFLDDFLDETFQLHFFSSKNPLSRDYLKHLLCSPPTDPAEIYYRQAVARELSSSDEQLEHLKKLYLALRELVWSFDTSSFGVRLDLSEYRMGVLKHLKAVIDLMTGPFQNARSALKKLHLYGVRIQEETAYGELRDIIEYDEHLGKVDIQIRIGAAGDLRGFRILKVAENRDNRYYSSPARRFIEKLKLYARGYRFSDADLVSKLTNEVFQSLQHHITPFVQLLGQIEFYLCGIAFREKCAQARLRTSLPHFISPGATTPIAFEGLFNPLLFQQNRQPVPCTLAPKQAGIVTLVTGPNSGGKTRLLQAVGLTQLLGQSGLYAPVAAATLPVASGLFASLREVDGVKDDEGRLGTELKRIQTLFQNTAHGAMVLLDELCSGTNPSEGEEIVSLVLEMLQVLGATTMITTHFLDYVRRLAENHRGGGLEFLKVELDGSQTPTYQFTPGIAESSLAKRIAARLGITRDQLAQLIRDKAA